MIDEWALLSVWHVSQRLQLSSDLIPYVFIVGHIINLSLTLHLDGVLQITVELVNQLLQVNIQNAALLRLSHKQYNP